MKDKFLNSYFNIVTSNKNYSTEEIEKMRYGIEGIYLTIEKLIIIILLSIIFGIFKEVIVLLLLYNFLRYFGFGFHAKTSMQCLIVSSTLFFIIPLLVIKNIIVIKYKFLIVMLCVFNFLLFAPSDTKKRPLTNKRKRIVRKTVIICLTIIFYIISFYLNDTYSNLIILSIISEMLMTNPVIYMIFNEPYNNYKSFTLN